MMSCIQVIIQTVVKLTKGIRIAEKKAKLIYLNRMKRGGNVEYFFGISATIRFSHRLAKRMNSIFSFLLFKPKQLKMNSTF